MYTRDERASTKLQNVSRHDFFQSQLSISSLFCMPFGRWHAWHLRQVIGTDHYNDQSHGCLIINSVNWLRENSKSFRLATNDFAKWISWGVCDNGLGSQILKKEVSYLLVSIPINPILLE